LPLLCKDSSVIFTTSLAARAAVGNLSAYAASKGATETLVRHMAAALGPRQIRVNAVAPGVVETDMSKFARSDEGQRYTLAMQALQRIAQPEDIAGAVLFLASSEAGWMTGATLAVDGGSKL
jgi:3-oxoacyl-[acyl-carrier protein] reductase